MATAEALCCSATSRIEEGAEVVVAPRGERNVTLSSVTVDNRVPVRVEPGDIVTMLAVNEENGEGELSAGPRVVRTAGWIDMLAKRSL